MAYGSGSVYLRGKIWWISYPLGGRQQNESSKSTDRKDAADLLKRRMGEIALNRALGTKARAVTVPDLLEHLEKRYIEEEKQSLRDLKGKIAKLKVQFKGVRAAEFGSEQIRKLKASMKRDGAADATVNRYLEVMRRAFTVAAREDPPLVNRVPTFDLLEEYNTRQGFITTPQYRIILEWLPEHLKGMLIFGYHLGMRKTALKMLRRDQVDWAAKVIRTEQGRGKKIGRVLPIYGDMIPWLEAEMATWPSTKSRWILSHNGAQIGDFRKSWATACKAAQVPGLLFHDLRRSAARNMIEAGIPQHQAMAITGHKTVSMFTRYAIVSEGDVKAAGEKLGRLMDRPSEDGKEQRRQ